MENRLGSGARALDSGSYNDLNRLSQLKVGKDRDGEENVRKVAQEFESLFLNEMLKSMRSATEVLAKDNPLNSQATKQYQDMYDQQLSVSLSKEGGGIGLADVLVRQLSKQTETVTRNNPFAQVARTEGAAWPSKPAAAAVESGRDDSRLLNQRRLALPGKASDRQLANVSATAPTTTGEGAQPLVNVDWKPATAFVPPKDRPLTVNGVEKSAPNSPSKTRFSSSEEFITTMLPMAEKAAERLGIGTAIPGSASRAGNRLGQVHDPPGRWQQQPQPVRYQGNWLERRLCHRNDHRVRQRQGNPREGGVSRVRLVRAELR